jgi:hypothetical protein
MIEALEAVKSNGTRWPIASFCERPLEGNGLIAAIVACPQRYL